MKTEIATTASQSQRLLACGVSADTADMCWYKAKSPNKEGYSWMLISKNYLKRHSSDEFVPAWSLSALLTNVLPKHLDDFPFTQWIEPLSGGEICEIEDNEECVLNGDVKLSYEETAWIVDYDWDGFTGVLPNSDNPIEACVRAIELLYANGYKLNEQ